MRRRAVVAALAVAATAAASARAQAPNGSASAVSLEAMSVSPADIDVLVGETVTWTNNSFLGHTVTADAGDWSSATLNNGQRFSHSFRTAGTFAYHCRF